MSSAKVIVVPVAQKMACRWVMEENSSSCNVRQEPLGMNGSSLLSGYRTPCNEVSLSWRTISDTYL